jgi:hypothetical protein
MERYSIANIIRSLKFEETQPKPTNYLNAILGECSMRIPEEIDFQSNEDEFTDVCYDIIGSLNEQHIQEEEEEVTDEDTKEDPEVMESDIQDKVCITITEDEKSILKQLEKAQKAHQKCFNETKHKRPVEKKRIRNRYASQVSRLKKKLEIYHLKTELGKAYSKIEILQKLLNK